MEIVDANIILRFLLDDIQEQADEASKIFQENHVYVLVEVLAEVIYVMEKIYKMDRLEISNTISQFISYNNILVDNKDIVEVALNTYQEKKIDFIDSILYGYSVCRKAKIHTFDKKLEKIVSS
ncbi:MAG: PIN domain-containing protein [Leptospiraceae bacterium]|nr:PIN domain-containing protein [Leptospiraceae bacterium]